jgi:hypothetical protein
MDLKIILHREFRSMICLRNIYPGSQSVGFREAGLASFSPWYLKSNRLVQTKYFSL